MRRIIIASILCIDITLDIKSRSSSDDVRDCRGERVEGGGSGC